MPPSTPSGRMRCLAFQLFIRPIQIMNTLLHHSLRAHHRLVYSRMLQCEQQRITPSQKEDVSTGDASFMCESKRKAWSKDLYPGSDRIQTWIQTGSWRGILARRPIPCPFPFSPRTRGDYPACCAVHEGGDKAGVMRDGADNEDCDVPFVKWDITS